MSENNTTPETVTIPVKMFRILGWIISATIAGAGGSIGIRSFNPDSYDSFTGQDGRDLKGEIIKYTNDKVDSASRHMITYTDAKMVYEVEPIDDRLLVLEGRIPTTFPPLKWQVDWGTWRTGLIADISAIKAEDRHISAIVDEWKNNCINHTTESEAWKRRIMATEQSIDNLWEWYKERGSK